MIATAFENVIGCTNGPPRLFVRGYVDEDAMRYEQKDSISAGRTDSAPSRAELSLANGAVSRPVCYSTEAPSRRLSRLPACPFHFFKPRRPPTKPCASFHDNSSGTGRPSSAASFATRAYRAALACWGPFDSTVLLQLIGARALANDTRQTDMVSRMVRPITSTTRSTARRLASESSWSGQCTLGNLVERLQRCLCDLALASLLKCFDGSPL
jgi:hypothetical protein